MRRAGVLAAVLVGGGAAACELAPADGAMVEHADVRAAWAVVDAQPIRDGRHFSLFVRACPADAELVKVDAVMPAHRHGMNYRPSIIALGDARWRVDGMMLHMRGAWELRLDLRQGDRLLTLRQAIDLP